MKTAGITAEYNPFHAGHLEHLRRTRELTGAQAIVCVLSGDFVQRGEAAVFSKYARAEAALRCGASLVLELPLPWCLASAEGFARGAVQLLAATGVVDVLSFGSESGDIHALGELAACTASPNFGEALREELARGDSFASARQRAAARFVGTDAAALLEQPNNILAVEYIKAASALEQPIPCVALARRGSQHDAAGSASELRERMERGEDVFAQLPAEAAAVFRRECAAGRGPVFMSALESALLSRLRMLPAAAFASLPDASEGLENLLSRAARVEPTWEAAALSCKSKRYALARIRRMLLCAALGVGRGMSAAPPPYLRVLAANEDGCRLLARMRSCARAPVLVRGAAVRELGADAEELFLLGSRAHDLYVLANLHRENRQGDEEFRFSPVIL